MRCPKCDGCINQYDSGKPIWCKDKECPQKCTAHNIEGVMTDNSRYIELPKKLVDIIDKPLDAYGSLNDGKGKINLQRLANHKFDTSDYGILTDGIKRNPITGMFEHEKVTRLEVIDHTGRAYVAYGIKKLELQYQDNGRTLKVFLNQEWDAPKAPNSPKIEE